MEVLKMAFSSIIVFVLVLDGAHLPPILLFFGGLGSPVFRGFYFPVWWAVPECSVKAMRTFLRKPCKNQKSAVSIKFDNKISRL